MTDSPRPARAAQDPPRPAPGIAQGARTAVRAPTHASTDAEGHTGAHSPRQAAPLTSSSPAAVEAGAAAALILTFDPGMPAYPPQPMVLVRDRDRLDELTRRHPDAAFWSWRAFWRFFISIQEAMDTQLTRLGPPVEWPPSESFAQKHPRALQKIQAEARLELAQANVLKIEFGPGGVSIGDVVPKEPRRADGQDGQGEEAGGTVDPGSDPTPAGKPAAKAEAGSPDFTGTARRRGRRKRR